MFPFSFSPCLIQRPHCALMFGRAVSLALLCSALSWPRFGLGQGVSNSLTKADITEAVFDALTQIPLNFSGGQINTVPWLYPALSSQPLGEYLVYSLGWPEGYSGQDTLRSLLHDVGSVGGTVSNILSSVDDGFSTLGAQVSDVVVAVNDQREVVDYISLLLSSTVGPEGIYHTNTEAGDDALRVVDEDVKSLLSDLLASSTNIAGAVVNMEGTTNNQVEEDGVSSTQREEAEGVLSSGQSSAEEAMEAAFDEEEETSSYLASLVEDLEVPFVSTNLVAIPGGESTDTSPQLSFPDFVALEPGITVFRDVDFRTSQGRTFHLDGATWSVSSWGSVNNPASPNSMLKTAGTMMRYFWGVGFGLWVFVVVRGEWRFYMTGGGSDAVIGAEQMVTNVMSTEFNMPWLLE